MAFFVGLKKKGLHPLGFCQEPEITQKFRSSGEQKQMNLIPGRN
nr:MAG TPA: hypothetical protein [Caudoviricetes sp.]